MLHQHGKTVTAAAIVASGASAVINEWVSVGAGIATIGGCGIAFATWVRGQRRRRFPRDPLMPEPLPLQRTSKDDYARQLQAWEIYRAKREQYIRDQKGRDD